MEDKVKANVVFVNRYRFKIDEKTKELFRKYLKKDGYIFRIHKMFDNEDSFEIDIENAKNGKRDYYATILEFGEAGFELAEHYYQKEKNENKDCQINIFGYFKTLGGALRNLSKLGNTTLDGRKPKEIYI